MRLRCSLRSPSRRRNGVNSVSATPVEPAAGATVTTSHPVFRSTLPANEKADTLYIADAPDTTPSGEFFSENVVTLGLLEEDELEVGAATLPLYAGAYWWTVESHDRDTFRDYYSAPSPFSVAATARVITIGSQRLDIHPRPPPHGPAADECEDAARQREHLSRAAPSMDCRPN